MHVYMTEKVEVKLLGGKALMGTRGANGRGEGREGEGHGVQGSVLNIQTIGVRKN